MLPADRARDAELTFLRPALSNASTGASESRRVILPRNLLGGMAERDAAQILEDQREQCEARVADVRVVRRAVLETFEKVGIRAQVDGTGRILRAPV